MLPKKTQQTANNYLKYTSLAFQMIGIILVFVFAGLYLDKKIPWKFPLFTILFTLLGVFASLYTSLKEFFKKE